MKSRGQAFQLGRSMVVSAALGLAGVTGCGGNPDVTTEAELTGEATFELSTVPAGAVCLEVVATQGSSVYRYPVTLPAVGASSSSVLVGKLPLGNATLTASVYSVACSGIGTASPDWLADSQAVDFRAGVLTNVTLTLRPLNPVRANVNFVGNIQKIFAGYGTSGLTMSDGTARLAGNWSPLNGGLVFMPYSGVANIDELAPPATYNAHGCALLTDGSVRCWGFNNFGELGPNGGALGSLVTTPVVVPAPVTNVRQVQVGVHHTCAINRGGGIYCWGANADGQLGIGSFTNTSTPTQIPIGIADQLAVGPFSTCVNQVSGGPACWGYNGFGQLGDGTTTSRNAPVYPAGLGGTVSLDIGSYHACAVRADGTVRCWGNNGYGGLGDGTTTARLTPTVVPGVSDATQVSVGDYFTCVVRGSVGSVSCWGNNNNGQLGDGTAQPRSTPGAVPGLSGVIALASGSHHTCALLQDRKVMCWGLNDSGQTGNAVLTTPHKPIQATVN